MSTILHKVNSKWSITGFNSLFLLLDWLPHQGKRELSVLLFTQSFWRIVGFMPFPRIFIAVWDARLSYPWFELGLPCPFSMMLTITPWPPLSSDEFRVPHYKHNFILCKSCWKILAEDLHSDGCQGNLEVNYTSHFLLINCSIFSELREISNSKLDSYCFESFRIKPSRLIKCHFAVVSWLKTKNSLSAEFRISWLNFLLKEYDPTPTLLKKGDVLGITLTYICGADPFLKIWGVWTILSLPSSVDWAWRIQKLHLCRGARPPHHHHHECSGYDTKQSYGEALVILWRMWSTPSLPSLPGSLWSGMVASDIVLSMGQIELFDI